ncbi:MAG: hypothetical protein L3J31_03200 [Bacteroidales bacterium]|nr:hypothetical protein [Bacteroidales bacterium]MCF6341796.1 hypothetical protein [Bacteroidales bacterium]
MKYLTIIAVIIFLTACGNQAPKQNSDEVVSHEGQSLTVTLANGEKWKVNFATNKGIRNMKELMQNMDTSSELSDYRELGNKLQKEFQQIFQRCDMSGEAHNQLHNYLMPMAGWFKDLKEGDLSRCQSATNALNEHLKKFDTYFK